MKPKTLRAIHANVGVEVAYRKALRGILNEIHADVLSEVVSEYIIHQPEVAQDINIALVMQRLFKNLTSSWQRRLNDLAPQMAKIFARSSTQHTERAMMQAFKKAGFTVRFNMSEHVEEQVEAVIGENVGLIKSIGSQYLDDVQQSVWQAIKAGHDMHTLSKTLQAKYDISKRRADFIARDQNNKAKAVIERERRLELGIKKAIWQHSHVGKKPRISHVHANGKEFDIEQGMYIDGEWIQPGELINCRCTSRAVIPGFNV
ncbi:phage head morphogenesis protein [Acinetobacter proteolyticus]|uniref:phage head morphogenesis protein n=1 Tax=Acinetobacter proteolyticus TaxID=1776741 RepID=UPI003D95F7CD